jgi:hypothetical protein
MISRTGVLASFASATARTARSRSVTTPHSWSPSHTGMKPTSALAILRAAVWIESSGVTTASPLVIRSLMDTVPSSLILLAGEDGPRGP